MASEHEHDFAWDKHARLVCEICGKSQRWLELEQQLANTREELRIALAQRQDYRATAVHACALLWEALSIIEEEEGDYSGWRARCRAFLHTKEASNGK